MLNELIGEIDEILTPDVCDSIVATYKENEKSARPSAAESLLGPKLLTSARQSREMDFFQDCFKDYSLTLEKAIDESHRLWYEHVTSVINEACSTDSKEFTTSDIQVMLAGNPPWTITTEINVVEYKKDEKDGYHAFHVDGLGATPERPELNRFMSLIVYLNDVEEGGETEFWFGDKIKAEKGKVLIFPATFPFIHKGHIPISNDKYIFQIFLNNPPDSVRLIDILDQYRNTIAELNNKVEDYKEKDQDKSGYTTYTGTAQEPNLDVKMSEEATKDW